MLIQVSNLDESANYQFANDIAALTPNQPDLPGMIKNSNTLILIFFLIYFKIVIHTAENDFQLMS